MAPVRGVARSGESEDTEFDVFILIDISHSTRYPSGIDVDEDGKVSTEAARGILEKIYGETLDDDTSAVAQQWRKVELESSKIDFEGFLKCYYLKEDPPPAAFSSELDDATAVFGKGRCPGELNSFA